MAFTRRNFLKTSTALSYLPIMGSTRPIMELIKCSRRIQRFGIQLYTLRDVIGGDTKSVLKQISDFGYAQIEGYEGMQGMFWGMGHKAFKAYLDDIGLDMISSHCNIRQKFEEKAAQAGEIGMKYLICPFIGPQKSKEDWDKIIVLFNDCGEICRKNGLKFAYHNHGYTFQEIDGIMPQDYLMDHCDASTVDFELDIYWAVTAGADPKSYFEKYPNRITLGHVKDRLKDSGTEANASCDLGTGIIDYADILSVAESNGMQYIIMEQERYDNSTSLMSAKVGAHYLKNLQY